jgi:mannosyltransferase
MNHQDETVTQPTPLGIRYSVRLLLLIILLGMALRCFHLGTQSLWHDEAFSLGVASRLDPGQILANQAHDVHPPLYNLLLYFWIKLVGIHDFTTRMLSLVAGVLSIPLIYVVGRKLFDPLTGLWAAFFVAVFPFHVYYSQEARMYTLLALLTTLSLWLLLWIIERNRWWAWGCLWLCLVLGVYTHYFFAFVILVFHLYLVLSGRKYCHLWLPLLIVDGLLVLALLPQATIFLHEFGEVVDSSYWLDRPNPLSFFTAIYFFIVSYTVPTWLNAPGLFVVIGILAVGLYEQLRLGRLDAYAGQRRLLNMGAFLPILLVLAISQFKPIFLERTLTICTPFLTLFLAERVCASRWRSPVTYLSMALGVLIVISLYRFYFDSSTRKPPMREAAQYVDAHFVPGDMVLHTSVGSFLPFLFYQPPAEHYLLWAEPNARKPAETYELFGGKLGSRATMAGHRRVWLVVALDHAIEFQQDEVNWFDKHFSLVENADVGGIYVRLYDCGGTCTLIE